MQDKTMNSASNLLFSGNKLTACEYGVRKEFLLNFSYSFWQISLGIFQLSLTVGVIAAAIAGQEMTYGLRLQRAIVLFPSIWNMSLPLYLIYED